MEALAGVSLAANLVAFIDFSATLLSKGTIIYKHGSLSDHNDLENVTRLLIGYNGRIQQSLESRQHSSSGLTKDEKALDVIATDCTRVAEQLLQRIERLKPSGSRQIWKSFRSALKSVWSKAEIDRIAGRLATYRQQLILQNQEVAHASTRSLIGSLDQKIEPLSIQLKELSRLLATAQFAGPAAITARDDRADVTRARDHGANAGNNENNGSSIETRRAPEEATDTPKSPSTEQFKILQHMIRQILIQVQKSEPLNRAVSSVEKSAEKAPSDSDTCQASRESEKVETTPVPEDSSEISKSIAELCEFAAKKGTAMFSRDADLILQSLDKILATVEERTESKELISQSRKRERANGDERRGELERSRSIKRVRGMLTAARCVAINDHSATLTEAGLRGKYDSFSNYKTIQRPEGTFGLLQRSRRLRQQNEIAEDEDQELVLESFSAIFHIIPNVQMPRFKITADFQQQVRLRNFTSLNPTITYSAMVPDDAEIIRCVKADDVHGIRKLVSQGLASLTDCDSAGRPLLYYANASLAFAVCRYLVDNGVDVDVFCTNDQGFTAPILNFHSNDDECYPWALMNILAIRRMLLQAGADPTLHAYEENTWADPGYQWRLSGMRFTEAHLSVLPERALLPVVDDLQESIKTILNLAGDFISLTDRYAGQTPLLVTLNPWGPGAHPEILKLLIQRGADVQQRTLDTGDTCLHQAVRYLLHAAKHRFIHPGNAAGLAVLIKAGLSVFDKNYSGITPWDLARHLPWRAARSSRML